ncbi:unnamed protein product [Lathyrus sativus]|nr:unnamed protein product [Lathyrus sativus]
MLLIRRSTLEGITRTSVHDNKSWSFLRMAIVFLAEAERCTRTTLQVHVVMQVKICLSSKGDGLIPDGRCCGLFKTT